MKVKVLTMILYTSQILNLSMFIYLGFYLSNQVPSDYCLRKISDARCSCFADFQKETYDLFCYRHNCCCFGRYYYVQWCPSGRFAHVVGPLDIGDPTYSQIAELNPRVTYL